MNESSVHLTFTELMLIRHKFFPEWQRLTKERESSTCEAEKLILSLRIDEIGRLLYKIEPKTNEP